jgi:uncharacterized protein
MNCPTCTVPLVMTERQGVEIDYCPKCRGVWLDRGELDKILERSLSESGTRESVYVQGGHRERPHDHHQGDGHGGHGYHKKKNFLSDLFD